MKRKKLCKFSNRSAQKLNEKIDSLIRQRVFCIRVINQGINTNNKHNQKQLKYIGNLVWNTGIIYGMAKERLKSHLQNYQTNCGICSKQDCPKLVKEKFRTLHKISKLCRLSKFKNRLKKIQKLQNETILLWSQATKYGERKFILIKRNRKIYFSTKREANIFALSIEEIQDAFEMVLKENKEKEISQENRGCIFRSEANNNTQEAQERMTSLEIIDRLNERLCTVQEKIESLRKDIRKMNGTNNDNDPIKMDESNENNSEEKCSTGRSVNTSELGKNINESNLEDFDDNSRVGEDLEQNGKEKGQYSNDEIYIKKENALNINLRSGKNSFVILDNIQWNLNIAEIEAINLLLLAGKSLYRSNYTNLPQDEVLDKEELENEETGEETNVENLKKLEEEQKTLDDKFNKIAEETMANGVENNIFILKTFPTPIIPQEIKQPLEISLENHGRPCSQEIRVVNDGLHNYTFHGEMLNIWLNMTKKFRQKLKENITHERNKITPYQPGRDPIFRKRSDGYNLFIYNGVKVLLRNFINERNYLIFKFYFHNTYDTAPFSITETAMYIKDKEYNEKRCIGFQEVGTNPSETTRRPFEVPAIPEYNFTENADLPNKNNTGKCFIESKEKELLIFEIQNVPRGILARIACRFGQDSTRNKTTGISSFSRSFKMKHLFQKRKKPLGRNLNSLLLLLNDILCFNKETDENEVAKSLYEIIRPIPQKQVIKTVKALKYIYDSNKTCYKYKLKSKVFTLYNFKNFFLNSENIDSISSEIKDEMRNEPNRSRKLKRRHISPSEENISTGNVTNPIKLVKKENTENVSVIGNYKSRTKLKVTGLRNRFRQKRSNLCCSNLNCSDVFKIMKSTTNVSSNITNLIQINWIFRNNKVMKLIQENSSVLSDGNKMKNVKNLENSVENNKAKIDKLSKEVHTFKQEIDNYILKRLNNMKLFEEKEEGRVNRISSDNSEKDKISESERIQNSQEDLTQRLNRLERILTKRIRTNEFTTKEIVKKVTSNNLGLKTLKQFARNSKRTTVALRILKKKIKIQKKSDDKTWNKFLKELQTILEELNDNTEGNNEYINDLNRQLCDEKHSRDELSKKIEDTKLSLTEEISGIKENVSKITKRIAKISKRLHSIQEDEKENKNETEQAKYKEDMKELQKNVSDTINQVKTINLTADNNRSLIRNVSDDVLLLKNRTDCRYRLQKLMNIDSSEKLNNFSIILDYIFDKIFPEKNSNIKQQYQTENYAKAQDSKIKSDDNLVGYKASLSELLIKLNVKQKEREDDLSNMKEEILNIVNNVNRVLDKTKSRLRSFENRTVKNSTSEIRALNNRKQYLWKVYKRVLKCTSLLVSLMFCYYFYPSNQDTSLATRHYT